MLSVRFADFNTGLKIKCVSKRSRSVVGAVGAFCTPKFVPGTAATKLESIGGFNDASRVVVAAPVKFTDDSVPVEPLSTRKYP